MVFEPIGQVKMPGELTVEEIMRVYPTLHSLYREWQNTSVTVSYGEHISGKPYGGIHTVSKGKLKGNHLKEDTITP